MFKRFLPFKDLKVNCPFARTKHKIKAKLKDFFVEFEFITVASSPSSSACPSPLLNIGLSNGTPLSSILNSSHPADASHFANIVTPSS